VLLEEYGLEPGSSHVKMDFLRERLESELETAKTLGMKRIICPWLPCGNEDEICRDAVYLEQCAQQAKAYDIEIGYHNHSQEFVLHDGVPALDILFEMAPSVLFEPDVYWIVRGGGDYRHYLEKYRGRICAIHAKDIAPDKETDCYTGQGMIDFRGIAEKFSPRTYPFIVEQESFTGEMLDGLEKCREGLMGQIAEFFE